MDAVLVVVVFVVGWLMGRSVRGSGRSGYVGPRSAKPPKPNQRPDVRPSSPYSGGG